MYGFLVKYKQVLLNGFILICLILVAMDFGKDFFLGAATTTVLVNFGESIGSLKRTKNQDKLTDEKVIQ